eukprot:scaffold282255_cov14-Tisochrysis_lutea.AAC.1
MRGLLMHREDKVGGAALEDAGTSDIDVPWIFRVLETMKGGHYIQTIRFRALRVPATCKCTERKWKKRLCKLLCKSKAP